jgi:hypothetical protein
MKMPHILLFVVFLFLSGGCATAPVPVTLSSLTEDPGRLRNKNVEVTAPVLDNPSPTGDLYRTWTFVLGGSEEGQITASEAGYNPATIDKAYHLVEQAKKAGAPVTVTGELKVGPHKALRRGAEIDLHSVSYAGRTIETDEGPYVDGFYAPYYYSPFFYPYPRPYFWDYRHYPYGYGW